MVKRREKDAWSRTELHVHRLGFTDKMPESGPIHQFIRIEGYRSENVTRRTSEPLTTNLRPLYQLNYRARISVHPFMVPVQNKVFGDYKAV